MPPRYRLIERRNRIRAFYCVDTKTGRRTCLGTSDCAAAEQIVLAKNQALRQPGLNLQIARAYLAGSDSGVATSLQHKCYAHHTGRSPKPKRITPKAAPLT